MIDKARASRIIEAAKMRVGGFMVNPTGDMPLGTHPLPDPMWDDQSVLVKGAEVEGFADVDGKAGVAGSGNRRVYARVDEMNLKRGGCWLYLDVQNPICRWEAEAGQTLSEDSIESQRIDGSAQASEVLYVARPAPAQTTRIETISVTILPTRGGRAAKTAASIVAIMGARDFTSTSYLNHWDARAASSEDRAEPEETILTITVPDPVFDRVWRELDSRGGAQNAPS